MTKKIKKPEAEAPKLKKSELGIQGIDYPIFCFKHLCKDYDIEACTDEDKKAFINQILNLSKLGWKQIEISPRHGMGYEKIKMGSIRPPRPDFLTPDVSELYAFRFSGKKPFLAFRNRCILHVIYIDSKFNVYDHE